MSYPIKYAVEVLKVIGDSTEEYRDITEGYIVSKCYVVEDRIKYDRNDGPTIRHIVTFPYRRFGDFNEYFRKHLNGDSYYEQRCVPERENLEHPEFIVNELYDTYEEAALAVKWKNIYLKEEKIAYIEHSITREKISQQIDRTFVACRLYESYISENTTDMVVDKVKRKVKE
ncbi:MAG: hypothetical protein IJK66_01480 [Bacilli bacterium]|nr:hypothetical protein [Bacilli bacterium]